MDEIEQRAFRAYLRRNGRDADCPSRTVDWIEYEGNDYIRLANVRGTLAFYRVYEDGSLKWVSPRFWETLEMKGK